MKLTIRLKGGAGSGFHGHQGRPGEVGGSLPADASNTGDTNPNLKRFRLNRDGTQTYTSKTGREYDVTIRETSQGDRVKISRQGIKIADQFVPLQQGRSMGQFFVINRISAFEKSYPSTLRNVTATISWDGKDLVTLNNSIKSHLKKNDPSVFDSDTKFFQASQALLDKSGIKLSDAEFDELGVIFDSWIPDEVKKYSEGA